jgi:hypothetical protein
LYNDSLPSSKTSVSLVMLRETASEMNKETLYSSSVLICNIPVRDLIPVNMKDDYLWLNIILPKKHSTKEDNYQM